MTGAAVEELQSRVCEILCHRGEVTVRELIRELGIELTLGACFLVVAILKTEGWRMSRVRSSAGRTVAVYRYQPEAR